MKLNLINSNVKIGENGPFDLYNLNGYDFSDSLEFSIRKGVYVFTSRQNNEGGTISHTILYVGKTTDCNTRFQGHHKSDELMKAHSNCLAIYYCDTDEELDLMEAKLINLWAPILNDKQPKIQ